MDLIPLEITVEEVKRLVDERQNLQLIDVREPEEFLTARIEGAELIPMRTIPERVDELHNDAESIVVFCHHGVRSLQVVEWLRQHDVPNARSMSGGIDAWSLRIDGQVPRY